MRGEGRGTRGEGRGARGEGVRIERRDYNVWFRGRGGQVLTFAIRI